ncbi:MAG: hypothetical protein K2K54_05685 [Lachnospiraceae bacterium]|nr:hypothetical protein [Lachnospiraceae bacterium]
MEQLVKEIVTGQTVPLLSLGILAGFATGTVLHFITYGIFKAFSLVNIK